MTLRRARSLTSRGFVVLILGSFAVYLVACSPGTTPSQSPIAAVVASEAALAAAGRAVLACYSVPRCASVAPKTAIKAAYDGAYAAVTSAQAIADSGGSPDMTATAGAMAALQGLVAQLPKTTP
jgi:hypothetical protein